MTQNTQARYSVHSSGNYYFTMNSMANVSIEVSYTHSNVGKVHMTNFLISISEKHAEDM